MALPAGPDQGDRPKVLRRAQRALIKHGALNFAMGLLAGFPYTLVIFRDHAKEWSAAEQAWLANDMVGKMIPAMYSLAPGTERAWKMAHLEGIMNGLMCFIVSSVMPVLDKLSGAELDQLSMSLVITGYGNTIASVIAAYFSVRGFASAGSVPNLAANGLFTVAIGTILNSVRLIVKGESE